MKPKNTGPITAKMPYSPPKRPSLVFRGQDSNLKDKHSKNAFSIYDLDETENQDTSESHDQTQNWDKTKVSDFIHPIFMKLETKEYITAKKTLTP